MQDLLFLQFQSFFMFILKSSYINVGQYLNSGFGWSVFRLISYSLNSPKNLPVWPPIDTLK